MASSSSSLPPPLPPAPRTSKQAQLLGLTHPSAFSNGEEWSGWNINSAPTSAGSTGPSNTSGNANNGIGYTRPPSPRSPSVSRDSDTAPTWGKDQRPSIASSKSFSSPPATLAQRNAKTSALLRSSNSISNLANGVGGGPSSDTASIKGSKKRGGFMSKLLRKGSRGDLREEAAEVAPATSLYGEFTGGGNQPPIVTPSFLPNKLTKRGDTFADPLPISLHPPPKPNGKLSSKSKSSGSTRRKNTLPLSSTSSNFSRSTTVAPSSVSNPVGDNGIPTLDMNLDSMEGIVNFEAIGATAPGGTGGGLGSPLLNSSNIGGATLSRTGSFNGFPPFNHSSGAEPIIDITNNGGAAGARNQLLGDPFGYDLNSSSPGGGIGSRKNFREGSSSSTLTNFPPPSHPGVGVGFWSTPSSLAGVDGGLISPFTSTSVGVVIRPGIRKRNSDNSISTINRLSGGGIEGFSPGESRRPSFVGITTANPAVPPPISIAAGAWTAPDSWAVKGETGALEHDSSEEEDDDDDDQDDEDENEGVDEGENEGGQELGAIGEKGDELVVVRPGTSSGRPTTRSGRPGTAEGMRFGSAQKNFMIRIFRQDSTFSTIPAPLLATAGELTATLGRKFNVNANLRYVLFMREKGTERRMGPNEKPILLQKRRLEQAGYTELDKLEDLGREDNSYLCKLIYKPAHPPRPITEEDLGESVEFVDLSGRNLERIPIPFYSHAHQIVSLNLSRNRPFDLATDFVQTCTTLRELVLSHMGLKRIPQAVKECFSLTRLDISNNHVVDFEHIALDELSELTSLKCHNNRLWTLPEYFRRFKMLKYLNLSNNRFEILPLVICDITSLVELDVSFNTISVVPPEIGQLVNLERLLLLANTINTLPPTLKELAHLKELDCRRNAITDLSAIAAIASLEVLRVEYNQASVLDANWAHMRLLSASNNSVTRFALAGTSSTLTSLNISHAKLASLATDMFEHLGSVEHLTFDSNQIRVLPEGVGSLSNLVTLSIKNNLLDELPASIGKLQRLQSLQISGNNLKMMPAQIWLCSQLTVLNASSNLLQDFPDPPLATASAEPGLDELDARKLSTISKAPSTSSGRLSPPLALSLQKLYLGDNRLDFTMFGPISFMTELRILNLSYNELYEVPPTSLAKCQQLEELYLSGNKLTSLSTEDLSRLINLKLLYVNGNKLTTLPFALSNLRNLIALDAGSNALKYNIANIPYDWNWNYNPELRYLNLSGNKRLEIKPGHQTEAALASLPRPAGGRMKGTLADFANLSRLHILGLIDVTLMIPGLPDESEDRRVRTSMSEINDMAYGIADTMGTKTEVLSLVDIVIPRFRSKDDEAIFGLFDAVSKGPNTGSKLVKYLQDCFVAVFTLELSRLKNVEVTGDALRRTFLGLNRDYGNLILPPNDIRRKDSDTSLSDRVSSAARTGAAGIVVYIRKKRMFVANAGNALAVVGGRGATARVIAKKHDPFDRAEIERIRTAEGWISARGAVNDEVDISRSFGFYNVFPAINAAPNVEEIELADTDEFVIIANRGLWEHMSYQTSVDVARTERQDPMAAAAKLRDLAISYGSAQNIMVMVLAVGDLFKAKKDYRTRQVQGHDEEGFYGQQRLGGRRGGRDEMAGERYLNVLDREVPPPVGLVALVFTDIRNSTALWESNMGMQTAIRMHNQLLRRQLRAIGGYEVKTEGDAFMVSFPSVTSALLWCVTCQLELMREDWPQEILDSDEGREILNSRGDTIYRGLSVRMGVHWGAPVCEADPITGRMDYLGSMVNRSSRISAVAEGGQITVSRDVIELIEELLNGGEEETGSQDGSDDGEETDNRAWLSPEEKRDILALRRLNIFWTDLGEHRLKGLETPENIHLVLPGALRSRLKNSGDEAVFIREATVPMFDITLVHSFERACLRLEDVATRIVHPHTPPLHLRPSTALSAAMSDEEVLALLASYVARVENTLSTLTLHQLGPFVEVLAALGGALKMDPRYIVNSLSRFGALMAA